MLAISFLGLVGAVAGGFFSLPMGLFVGVSSGLLLSILTRLFFYPLKNARLYKVVISVFIVVYVVLGSWVSFMMSYLLIARATIPSNLLLCHGWLCWLP
ncbi:MAG: hypothetical protein NZ558_01680 [Blastocatellia bacterium]|nr:hypothetical protein [Blastocatellia bacterium]